MSGKRLWGEDVSEDEDLDVEAGDEVEVPEPDPEPESRPAPPPRFDEGAGGRGGAYRLDENGNRVRVSGTASDGAREKNKASNAGPFAGRKHRERP